MTRVTLLLFRIAEIADNCRPLANHLQDHLHQWAASGLVRKEVVREASRMYLPSAMIGSPRGAELAEGVSSNREACARLPQAMQCSREPPVEVAKAFPETSIEEEAGREHRHVHRHQLISGD